MNRTAQSIAGRLSLRAPQTRSLDILAQVADLFALRKETDPAVALEAIRSAFPDFPSLCFALATGVGKTRLMGAFVAYLHIQKGIRQLRARAEPHYLRQADPRLHAEYPQIRAERHRRARHQRAPAHHRRQLRESAGRRTRRGEDVADADVQGLRSHQRLNISKLNKDSNERKGTPRIKRLSEYIGQSYFEYLAELDDLVLLMDESHRYRADAGVRVLNELRPVLGLELTATPQIETAKGATPFKNVIFGYPLSHALKDDFVKEPAVATRKDFVAANYTIPLAA